LAAAAERAVAEERTAPGPRPEIVRDYETWMEDMFGVGWQGNCRQSDILNPVASTTTAGNPAEFLRGQT
jgi:hypothetical protein